MLAGLVPSAATDAASLVVGPTAAQGGPAEISAGAANSPAATSSAGPGGESADNYVSTAPSATAQTTATQSPATQNAAKQIPAMPSDMSAANGSGPPATAEAPGEYTSSNGAATDLASVAAEYASPNSNRRGGADYSANTSSVPYYTAAQTSAIQSLATALGEQPQGAQPKAQGEGSAVVNAALGASPAGGPTAGATRWNPSDLVVRSDIQSPLAIDAPSTSGPLDAADEIAAPIGLVAPGDAGLAPLPDEAATTWAFRFAPAAPQLAGLLAGPAAANLALIEQGVDALFERLDRLGGELAEKISPRQCAHALLAVAGAAAAWEYARARYRETETGRTADGRGPSELRLRRRWSLRRRGSL